MEVAPIQAATWPDRKFPGRNEPCGFRCHMCNVAPAMQMSHPEGAIPRECDKMGGFWLEIGRPPKCRTVYLVMFNYFLDVGPR